MSIPISCPKIDEIIACLTRMDEVIVSKHSKAHDIVVYRQYASTIRENLEQLREINKQLRTDAGNLMKQLDDKEDELNSLKSILKVFKDNEK